MQITREEIRQMFDGLKREIGSLRLAPRIITRPVIINILMTSANTEYPSGGYEIPDNTASMQVKTRDGTAFRLAFEKDKVATPDPPYYTVLANEVFKEEDLRTGGLRLYVACGSTSKTVEIICWKREEV